MTHFCRLAAPALMAAPWQPDASLSHISPWASSHGHEGERSQVPQVPARSPDGRSMTAGRQSCLMASLTLCSPAHLASEQAWSKTGGKEGGLTGGAGRLGLPWECERRRDGVGKTPRSQAPSLRTCPCVGTTVPFPGRRGRRFGAARIPVSLSVGTGSKPTCSCLVLRRTQFPVKMNSTHWIDH